MYYKYYLMTDFNDKYRSNDWLIMTECPKEKIEELYENFKNPDLNDGVGLKNIYLRLKIYYGDEAGLTGGKDPDNRKSYPWGRENKDILEF